MGQGAFGKVFQSTTRGRREMEAEARALLCLQGNSELVSWLLRGPQPLLIQTFHGLPGHPGTVYDLCQDQNLTFSTDRVWRKVFQKTAEALHTVHASSATGCWQAHCHNCQPFKMSMDLTKGGDWTEGSACPWSQTFSLRESSSRKRQRCMYGVLI